MIATKLFFDAWYLEAFREYRVILFYGMNSELTLCLLEEPEKDCDDVIRVPDLTEQSDEDCDESEGISRSMK